MVTFELFVRPALRKLAGHSALTRPEVRARLAEEASHTPGRTSYQRGQVTHESDGGYSARITGAQGSGMLRSLVLANALLVLPSDAAVFPAGTEVSALLLD